MAVRWPSISRTLTLMGWLCSGSQKERRWVGCVNVLSGENTIL